MKYKLKNESIENKDVIQLICENRGVNYNNLYDFLNPSKQSIINPIIYKNLELAAKTIIDAVDNNLKIGVLVDSDVDGFCSAAMIINYLKDSFKFENILIYMHSEKRHGLTEEIMNQIRNNPVELLVIPDAGSSDFNQHKILRSNGIEVIVIDHHEVERFSDDAIVVNNQLNIFGNKNLSGGGMVLKVLECIDRFKNISNSEKYYDLAAVSLIGDCMILNNKESRYYVQHGLISINNPLLLELYNANKDRNVEMVSFDIAPTINAFIRMGTLQDKQDLFASMIGIKYKREISIRGQGTFELDVVEYVGKLASRIKSRQTSAITKALENEETILYENNLPFVICILESSTKSSLTGLIGNRLTEMYNKPSIVLMYDGEHYYTGSGRTIDTFPNFKDYCNNLSYFDFCAGHQGAFGCKIGKDMLEIMIQDLHKKDLGMDSDCYIVDKAYIDNVSAYEIMSVDELNNYWCRGFDKPKFYIKLTDLKDGEVEVIGQKRDTIRIKNKYITYLKFKCDKEEIDLIENTNIKEVEIIGAFSVNDWNDRLYPQVFIEHLEIKGDEKHDISNFKTNMFAVPFSDLGKNISW